MAKAPTHPRGWRTKRYILAALMGTLAMAVVVIAVSEVLSPARIVFSVTRAVVGKSGQDGKGMRRLNLTLSANNTSPRASVEYRSLIVYLQFTANGTESKLPLGLVAPPAQKWQSPGTLADIGMSGILFGDALGGDHSGGAPAAGVLVLAVVRFRVGMAAYTRPYDLRVLCDAVDYVGHRNFNFPVACNA